MGKWIRVDSNRMSHPKFRKAGAWGAVVVQAAWEISKAFDLGGILSDDHWDAGYLAEWTRFDRDLGDALDCHEIFVHAMAKAVAAGLIRQVDEGWEINDWNDHQPTNNAERQRRYRQKKGGNNDNKSNVTDALRDVTSNEVTPDGTGQDGTVLISSKEDIPQTSRSRGKKRPPKLPPTEAYDAADHLRDCIIRCKPDHLLVNDKYWAKHRDKWALELDRAHRIDSRSWERIKRVSAIATADPFWSKNIQSVVDLRKHFDRLEQLKPSKMEIETDPNSSKWDEVNW